MAKESGVVYVRMDANLKKQAEAILDELGISAAGAVQMLYKQIIMNQGIPFDLKLRKQSVFASDYSKEELIESLDGVMKDFEAGNYYTSEQLNDALFSKGK